MAEQVTTIEELISPAAAARILGIQTGTLSNWRLKRKGPPYYRLAGGRTVRYKPSEVSVFRDGWKVETRP